MPFGNGQYRRNDGAGRVLTPRRLVVEVQACASAPFANAAWAQVPARRTPARSPPSAALVNHEIDDRTRSRLHPAPRQDHAQGVEDALLGRVDRPE